MLPTDQEDQHSDGKYNNVEEEYYFNTFRGDDVGKRICGDLR